MTSALRQTVDYDSAERKQIISFDNQIANQKRRYPNKTIMKCHVKAKVPERHT